MRKIAFTANNNECIKKIMIYESNNGTYLFGYDTIFDCNCLWDNWYENVDQAEKCCYDDYNIKPNDWIYISEPHDFCNLDYIMPVRIKGRDKRQPEFDQWEILVNDNWIAFSPPYEDKRELSTLTDNERLILTGLTNEFEKAKKQDNQKAKKILAALNLEFSEHPTLTIRQETPSDYAEVYDMVKNSFATTDHSDGTEQDYLNEIRNKDTFIPELSLVAVLEDKIVGQIVLYKMQIADEVQLVLSPLSVHRDYFKQGIGESLIEEGCRRALSLGYKAVFLCGSPAYYERFGFVPTYEHEIYHRKDKTAKWCMVKELEEDYLADVKGFIDIE